MDPVENPYSPVLVLRLRNWLGAIEYAGRCALLLHVSGLEIQQKAF